MPSGTSCRMSEASVVSVREPPNLKKFRVCAGNAFWVRPVATNLARVRRPQRSSGKNFCLFSASTVLSSFHIMCPRVVPGPSADLKELSMVTYTLSFAIQRCVFKKLLYLKLSVLLEKISAGCAGNYRGVFISRLLWWPLSLGPKYEAWVNLSFWKVF